MGGTPVSNFDRGPYEVGVAPNPASDTITVNLNAPKTANTRLYAYAPPQIFGKAGSASLLTAWQKTIPLAAALFEGYATSMTGSGFGMVNRWTVSGRNDRATSNLRSLYLEPSPPISNYQGALKTVADIYEAAGMGRDRTLVAYGCEPDWNGGGSGPPLVSKVPNWVAGVIDALEQGKAQNGGVKYWNRLLPWNEFKGHGSTTGLSTGWETDASLDPELQVANGLLTDANYTSKFAIYMAYLLTKLIYAVRAHPDPDINGIEIAIPYYAFGGVSPASGVQSDEDHHSHPLGTEDGSIQPWSWDYQNFMFSLKWVPSFDLIAIDYSAQDFSDTRFTDGSYIISHAKNMGELCRRVLWYRDNFALTSKADAKNSAAANLAKKRAAKLMAAEWYAHSNIGMSFVGSTFSEQRQAMNLGLIMREAWQNDIAIYQHWEPEGENSSATGPLNNLASLWRACYFGVASSNSAGGLATNGTNGDPYLSYFVARLFTDHFGPGTTIYPASSSNPNTVVGPATDTECLVINTSTSTTTETLGGITYSIPALSVVVLSGVPPKTTLPIFNGPASAVVLDDGAAFAATASISGLSPSTTYHARARAVRQDGQGGTQLSPDITFTTAAAGGGGTIPPDQDPDNAAFNPGSYNTWASKFMGKGAFGVDPSCYSAATRTIVGNTTTAADLQMAPNPNASGRRIFMSNGSTVPDAVCPFKATGDIPPTTPGTSVTMPDGCTYVVNSLGRCIRTNAEGTDVKDVTGYVVLHGASVVNGSIAALSPDPAVFGNVSGNFKCAPYNCQLVQVSQFLADDLVTFTAPAPVNAGGPSPTTPSRAARCGLTINQKSYLFDLTNCHLLARNLHDFYIGSGDLADATWILRPSSIQAGSTRYPASGSVDVRFYFRIGVETTLSAPYTMGSATMNLVDASGFQASGFVQLASDEIVVAYAGKSGNQLTGCTTVVGTGTIASGKAASAITRQTATLNAPITTQQVYDKVTPLTFAGGASNIGVVGLNNSGPWGLQFQGDTVDNKGVKALKVCAFIDFANNTLKDQLNNNVTFPAQVPVRSPYGTGGHPLGCGGSTGVLERFYHEMRWGDGNKTGKGAREFTLQYGSDVLNPERFSNVAQAGHVDGVQKLGVDKTAWGGNRTGWSNERSGKNSTHAVLFFNAGNTGIFNDGQYLSGVVDQAEDRILVHGVNKGVSFNGCDRCSAQRSYFVKPGDQWYPNRFSGSLSDPILPNFDHVTTIAKTAFSGGLQNYASDPWQVGCPAFASNPSGVTSTTFTLQIVTAFNQVLTTGPIAWSNTVATLKANVTAALNALVPGSSDPDSNIGPITYNDPATSEQTNGWRVNIDFGTAIRYMVVASQDGEGIDVGCPHAPSTSTSWPSRDAAGGNHPLQNFQVASNGTYSAIDRNTGGNAVSDGCAPPLPPQAGSTVYDPTTYNIPAGATVCTTNAQLAAAAGLTSPQTILIPAGTTINRNSPLTLLGAHKIYGADPTSSILQFGIDARDTVGAEIHGITLQPNVIGACPIDASTSLPALITHRNGSGLVVGDVYLKGIVASHPVALGLVDRACDGAYVERVVATDFAVSGVVISDASATSSKVARRVWDVNVSAITHPTNRGQNNETGIAIGVPVSDGVKRLKVRDSGMIGVRLDSSVHSLFWSDWDINDVYGVLPTGPNALKEWGIAVYCGKWVGAQGGIAGAGACWGQRYRLGPNVRYGVYTEPYVAPATNPAAWKLRFTRGWVNASRTAVLPAATAGALATFGFFLDDGAQDTHIQATRFAGTFSGGAAIRDRGGPWTWGQQSTAYTRPTSAAGSTTKIGTDNIGGTVSYG
jgi:hypothetical protein